MTHQPQLIPDQPPPEQAARDAERAGYLERVREKLGDPECRAIEGFPIGEDEDILALSDPPYYTACPNPFLPEIIERWQKERAELREELGLPDDSDDNGNGGEPVYHREPFAASVSEGKNDPIHNAHSYHTKVPQSAREEIKRRVQDVFYAPALEAARQRAEQVTRDYEQAYPAAMRSFHDDLAACLASLRCPMAHHKAIRTTNPLERAFQESRRRTKVIPHFFTECTCLKLVFFALWQTSQRWRRVTMTELEQQQLALLRNGLGLPLYAGHEIYVH
jgi:hypothetical protein